MSNQIHPLEQLIVWMSTRPDPHSLEIGVSGLIETNLPNDVE